MLPKTVIDATITYTFQGCSNNNLKVKINPTLVARAVPDMLVGQLQLDASTLMSFWQDKNISVQTFSGSHILNSIGSSPTSQVAQIGGNILGGISKIVAVGLGVSVAEAKDGAPPLLPINCATDDKSALAIANRIKSLKEDTILKAQDELAKGVDEVTQKKDNAEIQAAQAIIATLQDALTITIKLTIDPGVSPINVDPDNDSSAFLVSTAQSTVQNDGLVATICPSASQLVKGKWFTKEDVDGLVPPKDSTKSFCDVLSVLQVNVYLDFPNGHGTMYDNSHKGVYAQTTVDTGDQYRDVAYIPLVVWRQKRPATPFKQSFDADGSPMGPTQLVAPQILPFGQFGVSQALPFKAKLFGSLIWQVTFLENGEITAATYTSKSSGVNATALFGSITSTTNSIATELRNAASATNQAAVLQGQADSIYQLNRLQLCQKDATSCPQK
jgi:hypothetical protein